MACGKIISAAIMTRGKRLNIGAENREQRGFRSDILFQQTEIIGITYKKASRGDMRERNPMYAVKMKISENVL